MTADPYRLPRTVTPSHYELVIAPDLDGFRFEGTTVITVWVQEPTTEIVLNAAELDLHSAVVRDASGKELAGSTMLDAGLGRATITFPEALPPGEATLTITSTGSINDQLRGFYRSTFTDGNGQERVIATTQFESTDARRAFPCWDEPEYKATFAITLLVADGLLALSNGAVVSERPTDGGRWVTFDTTMKMSTYLVAFVVGPLAVTEAVDVDGIALRAACVPGREHLASFALEVGAHALRYLAGYFAIPYPAGKLDLVALPDFAFGAMENLGCVTFRETALLVDRDNSSRAELERVADVVSHEIAHMWFGDLVTMRWWNGIWLNEAFATFMEIQAVDAFRPEWERWTSFSTERSAAMATDALAATRPIEYEVVSPADAEGMFDILTYQKGGAVLRMLETYLGADRFRDGIRLYLDRHRYANTETTDLWDAIEEATGEPVRSIMDSWIFQGGHPVVSVEAADGAIVLSQQRFRYLEDPSDASARWEVPVLVRSMSGGGHDRALLSEASITLPDVGAPVVVNAGGWGVFRTRYSSALFAEVIAGFASLEAIERYNLISDTWAMVVAGKAPLTEFLAIVELLGDERDPNVWDAALGGIDVLHRELPARQRPALANWARELLGPTFATLGWEPVPGEDDRAARVRASLLGALGTVGDDPTVQARARELHASAGGVDPDLAAPIVSILAWTGAHADYDTFWERIRTAATPQDEVRYLFRVPTFRDPDLLVRTLDATTGEVRTQNGGTVIGIALANRWAGPHAWRWLTEHWDQMMERIPDNSHSRMIEGLVRLTDPESLRGVPAFLEDHPVPSARKQVAQLLERQRVNGSFAERERATLDSRFPASR